jgi:Protein of unknown function (DUF3054)
MRAAGSRPGTLTTVTRDASRRHVGWVVAADAACLLVFVALGRSSHSLNGGPGWFLAVLWPFAVGWFAVAVLTRLYTSDSGLWWRAAVTCLGGVTLALVLRATFTTRATPVTFGIVALVFLSLATLGWRLAARGVARVRVRSSA